jgi:Phage tail assembly chaperone protein
MSRKFFYAASTRGFYISDMFLGVIPSDAIEITEGYHTELFNGQTAGKLISHNDSGYPILVDYPPPTAEEVRTARDAVLRTTDWTQAGDVSPATREKWTAYRQALRDMPAQSGFPENVEWPVAPI